MLSLSLLSKGSNADSKVSDAVVLHRCYVLYNSVHLIIFMSCISGPTAWNGLPVALRLTPVAHSALFLSSLKTTLWDRGWAGSAPE